MYKLWKNTWFFIGLLLVVVLAARYPVLGTHLKPWINTFVFVSMLLIGFRLELAELISALKNLKAVCLCLVCGFVLMPLLSVALGNIFFSGNHELYVGVVLAGAVPTTQASSVIWTDIARGNHSLAVVLMSIVNLLGVFISPLLLYLLLGTAVELSVVDMTLTLLQFILLPIALGQIVRIFLFKASTRINSASRIVNILIIWATVLTALSSSDLRLSMLAAAGACVVVHYLTIASLSYFAAKWAKLNHEDAVAIMFCSSQATLTVAAVIGFSYFAPGSILYVVLYHLFQQAMGQATSQFFRLLRL